MTDFKNSEQNDSEEIFFSQPEREGLPITIEPNKPIYILIKKLLENQLEQALQFIPQIMTGNDIEAVHKTRVGFRRIRSQLKIFKQLFKNKKIKYLRRESQQIGWILGSVRDLDVFRLNLESYYQLRFTGEDFETDIWHPLMRNKYDLTRTDLLTTLESQKFTQFIEEFIAFCKDDLRGVKNKEKWEGSSLSNINAFISSRLTEQFQTIQEQQAMLSFNPNNATFHKLRIEIKRFRYTLDFFTPILKPSPTQSLINSLILLQDHLGIMNDHAIAIQILENILAYHQPQIKSTIFSFLTEYEKQIIQKKIDLQSTFHHAWDTYQTSNTYRSLLDCIPKSGS